MGNTKQDLTGYIVGSWFLEECIGSGTQGWTYIAKHETTGERAAVKILHADATDKNKVLLFKTEAELLASLSHPNIEHFKEYGEYDCDTGNHVFYIAKSLVSGVSLQKILKARSRLNINETLEVAGDITSALAHAHARKDTSNTKVDRILHLDLKPSNILVECNELDPLINKKSWLIDFGFGVWGIRGGESFYWPRGTIPYMAPEQFNKQERLTSQTDLYQFGVLLYEMLTGKRPFRHRDKSEVMRQIIYTQAQPPTSFRRQLPKALDSFFEKALAKVKEERFTSVEQMFEAFLVSCQKEPLYALQDLPKAPHLPSPDIEIGKDGVKIAFTRKGAGIPLIYPPPWVTHQGIQWANPQLRSFFDKLTEKCEIISYDRRGCGLSDRNIDDLSWEAQLRDLELVIDHCRLDHLAILGISAAGPLAISYAATHPEKVSKLILYGTFARLRDYLTSWSSTEFIETTGKGWGRFDTKALEELNKIFIPGATEEECHWLTFFQRFSSSGDQAVKFAKQIHNELDVKELSRKIQCHTLIIHRKGDKAIPYACGKQLDSLIPNKKFVSLKGKMHPPWFGDSQSVVQAIVDFLNEK